MTEEELIKIWQSSPNRERIKFEKSRLMAEVQASLDRVHGIIQFANRRTTIAALIIVTVFTFYIYMVPYTLCKIASGLGVLFAVHAFLLVRKSKKNEPKDFTGTYSEYLHKAKIFLLDQKRLMDTSLYWSIIPGISICILFFIGFIESPQFTITAIIALCIGCIVLGIMLYFLSKWWVVIHITPNLKKVDESIKALEES